MIEIIDERVHRLRGFEVVTEDKRKTEGAITLPTRGSSKAMAYDFYANKDYTININHKDALRLKRLLERYSKMKIEDLRDLYK